MPFTLQLLGSAIFGGILSIIALVIMGLTGGAVPRMIKKGRLNTSWRLGSLLFMFNALMITAMFLIAWYDLSIAFTVGSFVMAMSIAGWNQAGKSLDHFRARFQAGLIGSSLYWFLAIFSVYKLMTLQPAYAGADTFMAALSLILVILITGVAALSCLLFVTYSKGKNTHPNPDHEDLLP